MKKLNRILLVLLVLCLLTGNALAQTVRFAGKPRTIPVTNAESEELEYLQALTIGLLGLDDNGAVELYADGRLMFASQEALQQAVPQLDISELPVLSELKNIAKGAEVGRVVALQQALIDLGYLFGAADGSYGAQSSTAVTEFQRAMGLEETGIADAVTQQLVFSLADQEALIEIATSAEAIFAPIIDRTETDLSVFDGRNVTLEYDDIAGTGFITNGADLGISLTEGPDIDQYSMAVRFGFAVAESKGAVTVKPAIRIETTSVRAPLVQSVILKSGENRQTVKTTSTASGVDGSKSVESNTFNLSADAASLLASVEEAGELKIRVVGKYQSYDIEVAMEDLYKIAETGEIAVAMLG